ncbi:DUF4192 domain-containing protein [Ornithinimicrobium cryptoxanthini]|uniref:DUF4192 domain-containing protein n=1 Tax=Ornithinimicrobium cryptoxanthini TaxID=2934161 RepID=UPI002118F89E|nr:DUF4192 domain-containing protein [Ornithinimicrobium cryptoxanthini]
MTTPKIRFTSLADLVVSLPHQLGYRPVDSLVLTFLARGDAAPATSSPTRITLKCRVDLPPDARCRSQVVQMLADVVRREKPAGVILCAFETDQDSTETLAAVSRMCESKGVGVGGVARVRGDRWHEVGDDGGVWRTLPAVENVPAVADLVYRGMQPGPSRAELTARVWGRFDTDQADQAVLLAELDAYADRFLETLHRTRGPAREGEPSGAGSSSGTTDAAGAEESSGGAAAAGAGPLVSELRFVERGARAWQRMLDTTPGVPTVRDLPPAVVAQGLAMLWDRDFRDALISWLAPGQLGPGMLPAEVWAAFVRHLPLSRLCDSRRLDRLVEVCGLVPDEVAAPVLSVTAQCAWILNNGTIANIAVERALEFQPDYTLAQLIDQLLQHGVRPPGGPFAVVA